MPLQNTETAIQKYQGKIMTPMGLCELRLENITDNVYTNKLTIIIIRVRVALVFLSFETELSPCEFG